MDKDKIVYVAGAIDRLTLGCVLQYGVGEDRQRAAVASPVPEGTTSEPEAVPIEHDAHVGIVAAAVARFRGAAIEASLGRWTGGQSGRQQRAGGTRTFQVEAGRLSRLPIME